MEVPVPRSRKYFFHARTYYSKEQPRCVAHPSMEDEDDGHPGEQADEDNSTFEERRWADEVRVALRKLELARIQKYGPSAKALEATRVFLKSNGEVDRAHGGQRPSYLIMRGNVDVIKARLKSSSQMAGFPQPGILLREDHTLSVEFRHWRHRDKVEAFFSLVPDVQVQRGEAPKPNPGRAKLRAAGTACSSYSLYSKIRMAVISRDS